MNRLTKVAGLSSIAFAFASAVPAEEIQFDSSVTGDGETTYTISGDPLRRETDINLSDGVEFMASAGGNNIAVTTRHENGATQYAGDTQGGSVLSSPNDSLDTSVISDGLVADSFGSDGGNDSGNDSGNEEPTTTE